MPVPVFDQELALARACIVVLVHVRDVARELDGYGAHAKVGADAEREQHPEEEDRLIGPLDHGVLCNTQDEEE